MRRIVIALVSFVLATSSAHAGGVTFTDIAAGGGAGLAYERGASESIDLFVVLTELEVFTFDDLAISPSKPHGAPGVALLDYDGDGDLDLYVTNGPAIPNSLFQNQLAESSVVEFIDVATTAGVDATDQDSSGVCFGDIDNDGDHDLLVLSLYGASRLFENDGSGTFTDISETSGIGGADKSSLSCSFADFDGDGLLDVVIANGMLDHRNSLAIVVPFDFAQHNQVLMNQGDNEFEDASLASGILNTDGFDPPEFAGSPTLTWAIAAVDYDQDGDTDIIHADDQGGVLFPRDGGVNYGTIHYFENDGTGVFTDTTGTHSSAPAGSWMGLSIGDLNADGHLDVFGSNLGDYASTLLTPLDPVYADFFLYLQGDMTSRWLLGSEEGVFSDPGVGALEATPFGWGTSMSDYDNDGDTDLFMHGGLYFGPVGQGSPATLLENDGVGGLTRDAVAFATSTDHEERTVQGIAMGDLNGDGFDDIVSVSNFNIPAANQETYNHPWGSPFDGGRYAQIFLPTGDLSGNAVFSGNFPEPGTLAVELSSGNDNGWIQVRPLGTHGLTTEGTVNRDGIGAIVQVTPKSGTPALRPVIGGASCASQDSLQGTFGLGDQPNGQVEILWPGGVRNRLYRVRSGSKVLFPEIPCSFDDEWPNFAAYRTCVRDALLELVDAEILTEQETEKFRRSAFRAFFDE